MSWFKVDDKFWSSPEALACSLGAIGLWTRAGSYCADQLTDGTVTKQTLKLLGSRKQYADNLVGSGLWSTTNDGYIFNNWAKFQPTKAEVLAKRERLAQAGRAGGRQSGASRRGENDEAKPKHDASQSLRSQTKRDASGIVEPPSRPVPSTTSNEVVNTLPSRKARAARIDPEWIPSQPVRDAMKAEAPNLDLEVLHRGFVDYWLGEGKPKADWDATWRGWMRREATKATATTRATPRSKLDATLTGLAAMRATEVDRMNREAANDQLEIGGAA